MPTYRIAGLRIASDVDLPGAVAVPVQPGEQDVEIRCRPVAERLESPSERGAIWELDMRRFLLCLPGVGRFLATDGRTLDAEPESGVPVSELLPFLLSTGLGAILHQRGGLVLHAATVADRGRAIAICGHSGVGKSTLAAALCHGGCGFVGDDVAAIGLDDLGRPVAWPDGRRLKLFADAINRLDLGSHCVAPVRSGIEKFYVEPPTGGGQLHGDALPLAAIYLLREARPPHVAGIEPVVGADAAQELLNDSYRRRLALILARPGGVVAATAATLRHVPVFRLTRPRDAGLIGETAEALRAHWRSLGG